MASGPKVDGPKFKFGWRNFDCEWSQGGHTKPRNSRM